MRVSREEAIERCYTCQYRGGGASCHYCIYTGELRGCDIEECPHYVCGERLIGYPEFSRKVTTSGCERLAQEIVLLAIEDYTTYLQDLKGKAKTKNNAYRPDIEKIGKEAEIFLTSDEFELYSDLDGNGWRKE